MASKLIKLADGILVQVQAKATDKEEISAYTAQKVTASLNELADIASAAQEAIAKSFLSISKEAATPIQIDSAEIELRVGFTTEGGVFLAKAGVEGNVGLKLCFRRVAQQ